RSLDAVVLAAEGDAAIVASNETAIGDGDAVGVARQIAQDGLGSRERVFAVDHPLDAAQWTRNLLNAFLFESQARSPKNCSWPSACALASIFKKRPWNSRDSTLTCTRKSGFDGTHSVPSSDSPPPGTIMWT